MTSNLNFPPIRPSVSELPTRKADAESTSGFMTTLQGAMQDVETLQASAEAQVRALLEGNGQDVHGALIAVEKADVAFQLMMQVRNKIVNAYQEISRMQF
ncbi:MAG TPA: flagellar hook-basal body complex protein FliE [Terriglobales bacterium]|nr:flagellar hook-basal body complex protein FliE [Terriglobales bacterium]